MYHLWFFLTVCIYGILTFRIEDEFEDLYDLTINEDTATKNTNAGTIKEICKRDIFLVVDMSDSIDKNELKDYVKPFLKDIIHSPKLKVGPGGTHVGLIRFDEKAELLFNVGDKTIDDMEKEIDGMEQKAGSQTRTDLAMKIVNEKFPDESPQNAKRPMVKDVVILITDGNPKGPSDTKRKRYAMMETTRQVKLLEKKKIPLFILGVGDDRKDFEGYMKGLATDYFDAAFSNMSKILNKILDPVCGEPENGICACSMNPPTTEAFTIEPEKSTVVVQDLPIPEPNCKNGAKVIKEKTEVKPQLPHAFLAGTHEIKYTFFLEKAKTKTLTCRIKIKVKQIKGTCSCDKNARIARNVYSEKSAVELALPTPATTCNHGAEIVRNTVKPLPPNKFLPGNYVFHYTFYLKKAKVKKITCPVIVKVKVLCQGIPYYPDQKVCCCGTIKKKKAGYECCDHLYYNKLHKRCCGNANLIPVKDSC